MHVWVGRKFQIDCMEKGNKCRCGPPSRPEGELVGETNLVVAEGVPDYI